MVENQTQIESDMDMVKRTLAKTAIYRGSTTVLLFGLGWTLTGNIAETSAITIAFNVLATAIYFFHERFWDKISWGKTFHPNPSIIDMNK